MKREYLGMERRVGTYVECKYTKKSCEALHEFVLSLNIPHPLEASKYHTTILYSRAPLPNIHGILETRPGWRFAPRSFKKFDVRGGIGECALVLLLDAPNLADMHIQLRVAGGTHDHDDYVPHVTLSYRFPIDHENLTTVPNLLLEVEEVRAVELDLNWSRKQ